MLYPDFNELVNLGSRASRLKIITARKSMASAAGDYKSPFRGQGLEFHEVRDYRPGDDVRNIDWRVTARTNRPHMKIFTEERERTVLICVDSNTGMRFGTRGTFKSVQAARAAAMLGWQANGGNDRVGCVVFGDVPEGIRYFAPARSRRALWQTLKLLSRKSVGEHKAYVPLDDMLRHLERTAPTGALVFIISDFMSVDAALEKRLANLHRRCDIVLIAITDPVDQAIPAMETLRFSDDTGKKIAIDTGHKFGRDTYAKLWRDNRSRLEDIAARRGIGIVDLSTARDVYSDLVRALRRLDLGKVRR
jgi:uncharacterized protein (DUF58 family)